MARWTDMAAWIGNTVNEGDGDGTPLESADRLTDVRGLVLHIASGTFDGTIAWQRNAAANVSSHFIVGRDGRCVQMVDTADRSWAQKSGNSTWLSVELEGFAPDDPLHAKHPGWERLTNAQLDVCARLLVKAHQVYGVPLQLATSPSGRGLGHHSMGAESGVDWGHSQCPGAAIKAQKPTILARAIQLVSAPAAAPTPTSEGAVPMYVQTPDGAVYAIGPAGPVNVTYPEWKRFGTSDNPLPPLLRVDSKERLDLFKPAAAAVNVDADALAALLGPQLQQLQRTVDAARAAAEANLSPAERASLGTTAT